MKHIKDLYHKACGFMAAKRDYAIATALGVMASSASAQSQGWLGAVRNVTTLGRESIIAVTVIFFLLGLTAFGYGGKLLWDKSNDRGDDIKMSKIVWCFAGGTVMCAIGFFAAMSVVTAGGTEGDLGRRINIQ